MNKSKLMAVLMATALVVSFSLATGEKAEPVGKVDKPREMKITPVAGPFLEIDASGAPAAPKDPTHLCVDQWQGEPAIIIESWFTGDETYAVYQNPTETGCENTYPFGITDIIWHFYAEVACILDVQPVVYEDVGTPTCPAPGPILCSGPRYSVPITTPGGKVLTISFGDTCCVDGPYFAGFICSTFYGFNIINIVTDDGVVVPPETCRVYNDWGLGWKDLVADEGAPGNLTLWSQGYNTDQNLCGKILPGSDLLFTPGPRTFADHFNSAEGGTPLPSDFFGPGSDPFDGRIDLSGVPLSATEDLKTTDAIVERLENAFVPDCPSSDTIDVIIRALHLGGTITVTYNGGQSPELWDVDVCLSQIEPQQTGNMTINRECAEGGTFTSTLPVISRMVFTQQGGPGVMVIDTAGLDTLMGSGYWLDTDYEHLLSPLAVVKANGGLVDHDCDGTADAPYPGTSDFIVSARPVPCSCISTAVRAGKTLTVEESFLVSHGIIPTDTAHLQQENAGACCLADGSCIITTESNCNDLGGHFKGIGTICQGDADGNGVDDFCELLVIPPGVDLFKTPNDSMTVESLFTVFPMPPDFFGPGSDPFDGIIVLEGLPLTTVPPGILGPTDVIVERLDTAWLRGTPSADTVNIELVGLSLTSTSPITVTYDGGQNPEEWQVDVCLSSDDPPPDGFMCINRDCDSGGSFAADFYNVDLKATFTRVNPPGGPILVKDSYRDDWRYIHNGRWSTFVPPLYFVCTSPGQVEVDGDCDPLTPEIVIGASSGNFYPGITLEPCPPDPPINVHEVLTLLDGSLIDHQMSPCAWCCNHDGIRGDVNYDMAVNVADLTYLVCHLFCTPGCPGYPGNCPAPPCFEEGDVNGDASINVADLTYLVCHLFCTPGCTGYPGNCPPPAPCP